ncbi:hypothetical protein C0989_009535, partial [Termitomyces sp. Mn162]
MKVGPPRGGRKEGAPSRQEKGKRRASPSPEAGPSKRARGEQVMGGPPGSAVYSPTSGVPVEQSADGSWSVAEAYLRRRVEGLERLLVAREGEIQGVREERDGARRELDGVRRERDLARKDKDVAVGTATERLSRLQELEVRTVHLQARAEAAEVAAQQAGGPGVRETQQGSSAGEVQAAGGVARQQGGLRPARSASLGPGASHPSRRSVGSAGVHPRWVGEDARGPSAGVGSRGNADGASVGRASAEGDGRPRGVVGDSDGRGGTAPRATRGSGGGSGTVGGVHGGKGSGVRVGGGGR